MFTVLWFLWKDKIDRNKSILKSPEPRMDEEEKAAFVENLRKVKPKSSLPQLVLFKYYLWN